MPSVSSSGKILEFNVCLGYMSSMTKSICLFNHKGGVSKTTTAFNLGWSMATSGKKVLLVDLDSQCNLTGIVLGFNAISDDVMDSFYSSRNNLTMRPIVDALINGIQPDAYISGESNSAFQKTKNENLSLLPGHLDVSDLDSQISVSLKISAGIPATRNIPGNLPKIILALAQSRGFDYVIYDLSPNVGGLNEVVLMSSDYFIVPTSPDFFCWQAVGSLTKNILKWHAEISRFKAENQFGADHPIKNRPMFIGSIQQRYRPRMDKPAKSFDGWITKIRGAINTTLVPALEKIHCAVDRDKMRQAIDGSTLQPYDLAQIPDFNSLIAISQQLSKPIYSLTDDEINKTGNVFGHALNTMTESRNGFLTTFEALAKRVVFLTS
jgi:cellulose biosynthesis protein BcsQ